MEALLNDCPNTHSSLLRAVRALVSRCNADQTAAILHCFNSEDVAIRAGPSGNGKTTIITIIVLISVLKNQRVLLSSHTHTAIDNVLIKLLPYRWVVVIPSLADLPTLRIGDYSRLHPSVRQFHLSQRWSGSFDEYVSIMNDSLIVGATVYTSVAQFPRGVVFDRCIIDEAGQITEPSTLQVMLLSHKTLLVGDSMQLPPLVQSNNLIDDGLSESLLSRPGEGVSGVRGTSLHPVPNEQGHYGADESSYLQPLFVFRQHTTGFRGADSLPSAVHSKLGGHNPPATTLCGVCEH